ncbi:SDR family oxidoreductase [Pedobacter changchengzhani]|uniref:SDR family oxidoreductase n=1 Tax=Pedobacter changchengzhani TaxID=2529274 RepID=A0A4R5MKF2_9SPHI|nr:SDR family oxidoreductase [Pedobacter changchengzhani]TDG36197.1 SDR family oxidoreductase [Pedobacter changchengzhani]
MSFVDKNILIIGASSGIGAELTTLLTSENANIYAASRNAGLDWPSTVRYQPLDVMENTDELASFLPDELHGLVYSVGNINLKPFARITAEEMAEDFKLNVIGAAMVIQKALKALKNAGGASIVLISSVAAKTGMGFHASTAAAKSALEGFAVSLAAELASSKIRVNVVAPSLTETPLAEKFLNTPEKKEAAAKRHPIGRFGTPADVSNAISFLLSDESSWITGQVIGVDGGMSTLRTNM